MAKFDIEKAYEPNEVDLWGQVFYTRDITQDLQEKIKAWDDVDDSLPAADQVAALAARLDLLLVPSENGSGSRSKPSTILKRKWAEKKLGVIALRELCEFVFEGPEEDARPT